MYEIYRTNDGQYYWRLRAANYETLCDSESYTTKQAAYDGIAAVKRISPTAPIKDCT